MPDWATAPSRPSIAEGGEALADTVYEGSGLDNLLFSVLDANNDLALIEAPDDTIKQLCNK